MPDISVLIPAYIDLPEKADWFKECLASVRRQTFMNWEAIVIDDASPIPFDTAGYDHRFRFFKASHNQGPARCRNTAAALAESEAIIALDADDQFATDTALEKLYETWQQDKSRIVYGNLQRLKQENGVWTKDKTFVLGEYSFESVQELGGLFPVTALHSIEAHQAAGGWKPELDAGLEDVEYWLSCGERDFAGLHINHITLIYRQHENSRSFRLRNVNRRKNEMELAIVKLHKDTYEGKYPMGCKSCGSKTSNNGIQAQQAVRITTLDDYPEGEKVWVEYVGGRQARFDIAGKVMKQTYTILGQGHKFQVHINDLMPFKSLGRGRDFLVGIPTPINIQPEATESILPPAPQPQLAEVVRLDRIASLRQGSTNSPQAEPVAIPAPLPVSVPLDAPLTMIIPTYDLSALGLSPQIQEMLEAESWTVEKLAAAKTDDLMPYRGIGAKRAQAIIEAAKEVVNG